ncbi:hypothetical protein GALMADRAFT_210193 [Galerina marginata CBS 339.88]|uniref:Uncharacterized protein n=1 Tax=Galerina marginata (strain CBS 339.88) TaxID=685588 RepID=A0A067T1P1_GALM3|nr:hypothetical protein GALMADRAFT_210193 [Galerina marginata CBS 339.88]
MSNFAEKASSSFATLNAKEVTKSTSQAHQERAIIEEKISSHNSELLSTENRIKRLRNKSYDLNEQLNRTSPIMSLLSLDVLTSIFAVACDDYRLTSGLPVQFLIGRVCREWRRVAWSTPHLWRKVLVEISEERFEVQDALFQEWIGRTAASPLHIHLTHSYEWEPPIAFFNQLLKTCHRWIHFEYSQSSLHFQLALALEGTFNFPMLKSFNVTGVARPPGNLNHWQLNSPPQLRSLHFLSRQKFDLEVNWDTLEDVNAMVTLQGCIDMLSLSCSPKSLRLYIFANPKSSVIPSKARYCLQHLISFDVEGRAASVACLLRLITTPAAKELSIQIRYHSSAPLWIGDFAEFYDRSASQLTKLTFKLHHTSITD